MCGYHVEGQGQPIQTADWQGKPTSIYPLVSTDPPPSPILWIGKRKSGLEQKPAGQESNGLECPMLFWS